MLLACNAGSTSLKFQLFEMPGQIVRASGKIERIGTEDGTFTLKAKGMTIFSAKSVHVADYLDGVTLLLDSLISCGAVDSLNDVAAAVFKTVHAGPITETCVIDEKVMRAMEEYLVVSPMHNRIYLDVIRAFMRAAPSLRCVAVFEPDFHRTMPDYARTYGIPYEWTKQYGIQKYGFHGASHCYIAQTLPKIMGLPDATGLRAISCHLGGSSSLCALRDGLSVDTSMGFSNQSGVINGTRNGDLDVYALFFLYAKGFSMKEINDRLYNDGGLKGISGLGEDIRDLEAAASSGNRRARLALAVYCYEVKKYIGAYTAALGGLDALVFTGGIGERSAGIRAEICKGLECLGICLDEEKNISDTERTICAEKSPVKIYIIPANEELVIAQKAWTLLDRLG